jgi:hypothetical protein
MLIKVGIFTQDNLEKKIDKKDQYFVEKEYNKFTSLKDVLEDLKIYFKISPEYQVRAWASLYGSPYRLFKKDDEEKELQEIITRNGQQILMEIKKGIEWLLDFKHKEQSHFRMEDSNEEVSSRQSYISNYGDNRGKIVLI